VKYLIAVIALMLAGCSSLNSAGTAKYSVEPIVTESSGVICCRVSVENGKEYASLKAHVERRADGSYVVDLDERAVKAFEGQAVTGGVVESVIDSTLGTGLKVLTP